ncbi:MAG: zinc ribbon domain-containing protein [Actinomycetota bacterium]
MDPLLDLQRIDSAIARLEHRRAQLEAGEEIRAARAVMERGESVLGELRLEIDALGRDQQRLEHEVDTLARRAEAEKTRLYGGQISNPKELDAIQHEIANIGQRKSRTEDDLLVLLERREELEATATEADREVSQAREALAALGGEADAELDRIEADLVGLAAERTTAVTLVDAEVLELYDDLRAHKHGVGAAALVDGVCQACHEALSAMELDRIRRSDGVRRCEHCRRILILA